MDDKENILSEYIDALNREQSPIVAMSKNPNWPGYVRR